MFKNKLRIHLGIIITNYKKKKLLNKNTCEDPTLRNIIIFWPSEFEKHKTNLHKGTLLLSINGTIGNLAFYKGESVVLGKSAAYLIFIPDFVLPFAYYLLSSDRVKKFFNYEITGTTIRNLSLKSIKSTLVGIPSTLEQKKISNIISSIDLSIKNIQNKLSQTQSLKKSLMQDLLTGKVRVTVN